jgi:hypothetical protein
LKKGFFQASKIHQVKKEKETMKRKRRENKREEAYAACGKNRNHRGNVIF